MKVLHVHNFHRFRAGADQATQATIRVLTSNGIENHSFIRDSSDLPAGVAGKMKAFTSGLYARHSVEEFKRLLDDVAPDVVHIYELYPLISPWILPVCTERRIPVVMTCYDYDLTCPVATHYSHGEVCTRCLGGREHWAVLRNCRSNIAESAAYALRHAVARHFELYTKHVVHFITLAEFQREWLVEHAGISRQSISVVPPVFSSPASSCDPSKGSYVAYAGRFAPEKGITHLIGAAKRTGLPFRFAGDSPTLAAADGIPNIELVSIHSKPELAEFYCSARLLVAPSTWFETFPAVIAEAMSHGIPVVSSRIGVLSSTIEDGVTGLLARAGDDRDLAEKILSLWSNPQRCREIGLAGRDRVGRLCSAEAHLEGHLSVYRQVIGQ